MPRVGSSQRENEYEAVGEDFRLQDRTAGREEDVALQHANKPPARGGESIASSGSDRNGKSPDRLRTIRKFECRIVSEVAALLHNLCKSDLQTIRRYEEHRNKCMSPMAHPDMQSD